MNYCLWLCHGLLFWAASAFGQSPADGIVGVWQNSSGSCRIKIEKVQDAYEGSIIWLNKENAEELLDEKNLQKEDRDRKLIGAIILQNLRYNEKSKSWGNGMIYNYSNGSTYGCEAIMNEEGKLEITEYIGLSFFGTDEEWVRVEEP